MTDYEEIRKNYEIEASFIDAMRFNDAEKVKSLIKKHAFSYPAKDRAVFGRG